MSVPGKPGRPNTGWEPKFLDALRDMGNITRAARKAKVSRWQVYRKKQEDKGFAASMDEAIQVAIMTMEAEAYRRAVEGTLKPVFQGGARVGLVREYSDTLLIFLLKAHKPQMYRENVDPAQNTTTAPLVAISADLIAPLFVNAHRDIQAHRHTEYVFHGGRGSTKSSFISLEFVMLLVNNPDVHGLVMRQVKDTLRHSVYAQLVWAIAVLGLTDRFKCTVSPLEITYRPTGQTIYFRGADEPGKIKSIKPPFGYIGLLWFEELDQFYGPEAVRNIEQSAIRGGDLAWIFKSFNPPQSAASWANKYVQVPKASQLLHRSTYLDVPPEWLGQVFLDEAEHLKEVNPIAYEHEYLGVANGTGGLVFGNLQLRAIADEEITQFDQIRQGVDWGYFPDPFAWNKCHYDAARMTLYIFDELRLFKAGNEDAARALKQKGVTPADLLICDSAEPKSIADFIALGLSARGAEKGADSVPYSMKWLQRLRAIVIDPARCPHTAQEFADYELERDKEGNFISQYPDQNNHHIDATRYALNLIWRRKGQ